METFFKFQLFSSKDYLYFSNQPKVINFLITQYGLGISGKQISRARKGHFSNFVHKGRI